MPLRLSNRFLACALTLFLTLLCFGKAQAQVPADVAVQVHATVQNTPPEIIFHWPADPNATGYTVQKKPRGAAGWTTTVGSVFGTDTTFLDNNVTVGEDWEYRIIKNTGTYTGQGYCYTAIERPAQDYFGKLLLVVDTTYATALAPELQRLEADLWGDGWQVIRIDVDRNDSVTAVKQRIQDEWVADPLKVRSVFLLGHVPVPYSGNLNPDGHPDHQGAWPADVYYGEMNGSWTDQTVNNSVAARPQNQNTPGDGKFDQSVIPGDVELEIGRVDFANMPTFSEGEEALLRRYLDKDHAWRMKAFTAVDSAVVDDNFGYFGGEAFASSAWRNFGPLVGSRHVYAGDYLTDLRARDHLWSYGCGGGWYQGASGVGATPDLAADSLRGVFTMLFGSYHGDWDSDDNFMRAALAGKGNILSCAWAGRPNWHFHHMGLGEPIGHAARVSQNNYSTYVSGNGVRGVHIALMGDPGLRMHVCAPPGNLTLTAVNGGNAHELNWTPSPDPVLGYVIYRQDTVGGRFWRIGTVGMNTATYTDSCIVAGDYRYMVRAEELRTGYSGSYHNLSQGVIEGITNTASYYVQCDLADMEYCPGDSAYLNYFFLGAEFCSGNVFTVEWSDQNGSFAQPTVIGSVAGTIGGGIWCQIPNNAVPAIGYRIRVNASNPQTVGADNGLDIKIDPQPTANFSYTQSNLTYQFTSTGPGYFQQAWDFGDGNTSLQIDPQHVYAQGGTYTVQLIGTGYCGSDTVEETLALVGVGLQRDLMAFRIVPNPAGSWFEVHRDGQAGALQHVKIYDLLGQAVHQEAMPGDRLRIETGEWPRGFYVVEVQGRKGTLRQRLVLE